MTSGDFLFLRNLFSPPPYRLREPATLPVCRAIRQSGEQWRGTEKTYRYKLHQTRPWLGLVDLSRIPSGTFFREVHPASEMGYKHRQNRPFPDVGDLAPKARKTFFTKVRSQRAKGHSKKRERHHDENLPALATYLPTFPSTAKSRTQRRRSGRGGSPISRPVLFLLRTCANVRFSVQIPPKPAGDLKIFRARAREPLPRAARTTAKPPKCHITAAFGCRWPQNRGGAKMFGNIFAGAGLPTYLSWFFLSFF